MNRTIKQAKVRRFDCDDRNQIRNHMTNFVSASRFGRKLKTLKGLTPYEFICKRWTIEPERFTPNPIHQMPGLNTQAHDRRSGADMIGSLGRVRPCWPIAAMTATTSATLWRRAAPRPTSG